MKNKLLGLLTFGFISQFAMANGITGLPNGTFSGSGTWSGPLHMSGDYTNTTTIEGNNFLGLSFHKGKLNRIAFSTVFDESSGTFMVEMKGIEVGSGSCAVTDENVTTCEFSIPKKNYLSL